jgi:hypothetical protein
MFPIIKNFLSYSIQVEQHIHEIMKMADLLQQYRLVLKVQYILCF